MFRFTASPEQYHLVLLHGKDDEDIRLAENIESLLRKAIPTLEKDRPLKVSIDLMKTRNITGYEKIIILILYKTINNPSSSDICFLMCLACIDKTESSFDEGWEKSK